VQSPISLSWIGNPTSIKWVAGSSDGVVPGNVGRHDKAPNMGHVTLERALLTTNPFPDVDPKFSPDGEKILYTEYSDSSWSRHIAVMNSDGSGKEPLTNGGVDGYPAYSPDGTKIAFARWVSGETSGT
jgi:hypothetical protein